MTVGLLDGAGLSTLAGVFVVLIVATVVAVILQRALSGEKHAALIDNLKARVFAWWPMTLIMGGVLALGEGVTIVLFVALSVFALREFIKAAPDLPHSRWSMIWLFLVILPIHYLAIWQHWYGFYAIFIPVYAFLFLPTRNALTGRTDAFLRHTATTQWALMVSVYCLSHAPALLQLPYAMEHGRQAAEGSPLGSGGPEGANLLIFLVLVVQGSDVLQYIWGKTLGRHHIAPTVSPNKTVEGFVGGVLSATALGAGLWWLTPFTWWQAGILALVSCLLGFAGGLVMSAIKRDAGIKDFGAIIPGHGGIMDRLDSLCFAAPVLFHLIRFFFT